MTDTDTENRRRVTQDSIDHSRQPHTGMPMSETAPLLEQLRAIRERLENIEREIRYQGQRLQAVEQRFAMLLTTKLDPPAAESRPWA